MLKISMIIELRERSRAGIVAIPFRRGRRGKGLTLPNGTIVEVPLPDQRREAPARLPRTIGVASGGGPADVHHANLGLIVAHVELTGIYLLPNGTVAAVYGADAVPLG